MMGWSQQPKRRPKPSTVRRRKVYANRKSALILFLGGACEYCGSTKNLTFDHKNGIRDWEPKEVHSTKRLRIYTDEALLGLIQLLCLSCNSSKGDSAEDDEEF